MKVLDAFFGLVMFIIVLGLINIVPARLSDVAYVQDYIALGMFGLSLVFLIYTLKQGIE